MIAHQCFVDSNIIIYAHDHQETKKQPIAKQHLNSFWEAAPLLPFISIQVLQECFSVLTRKRVPFEHAQAIIELYCQWNVVEHDKEVLLEGIRIKHKYQLSIWDAFIVSAAKKAKAKYILTEDFGLQQEYEGIKVINPFKEGELSGGSGV